MFAVIVAGRLPQTSFSQVDASHLVFQLEQAEEINHVTVFMTGETAFPTGYAATVHLLLPGQNQWKLLGCLKNSKPSSIYRLKGLSSSAGFRQQATMGGGSNVFSQQGLDSNPAMFSQTTQAGSLQATLGISVETEDAVDNQIAQLKGGASAASEASMDETPGPGALVRAGTQPTQSIDPQMALLLAPKIGESQVDGSQRGGVQV